MTSRGAVIIGLTILAIVLAAQYHSIRTLRSEITRLREEMEDAPAQRTINESMDTVNSRRNTPTPARDGTKTEAELKLRMASLEDSVAQLNQASEYLMDRGQIPPSAEKLTEYQNTFLDPNASARDRLAALRLLRSNDAITPTVMQSAAAWLADTSDAGTTRALLRVLNGLNDPSLLNPVMQIASTSMDDRLREQAMRNLGAFADNPEVEELLWTAAGSDANAGVRRRAASALREAPMTDQRLASMRQRALDANTPLELRRLSLLAMQEANVDFTDVAMSAAQNSALARDRNARLRYIDLFDDVNHPAFIPPIVQDVQDQDPEIRRRATDALVDYRDDPAALEWLQYLAQNDPDPRVRAQASRAFRDGR